MSKELKPLVVLTLMCIRQALSMMEENKVQRLPEIEDIIIKRVLRANYYMEVLSDNLEFEIPPLKK